MAGFELRTALLYCVSTLGVAGSVLCIYTMSHLSFKKHSIFRLLLTTMCYADLCFNVLNFSAVYFETNSSVCVTANSSSSLLPLHFLRFVKGLMQSISLFCDLSTALLALERYLSVCKPIFWHTVSRMTKLRMCYVSLTLAALASGMRFTCSFTNDVLYVYRNNSPVYNRMLKNRFYYSSTFEVLNLITGIVIPCILIAVIFFLTISVILGIKRRAQMHQFSLQWSSVSAKLLFFVIGRKLSTLTTNTLHERKLKEARNRAMLIVVTLVGFLLDQFSYIFSATCYLVEINDFRFPEDRLLPITFGNVYRLTVVMVVKIVCAVMESLAHTINFYAYVLFNATFRERFKEKIACNDRRHDSV
ncbi:unnamed protein product [Soboliphyme baturini]|uniref:G_PROTEIN_RECEP_F1_2 domain-containing protein n=1 Tax=Soboliphyme baturini TaxID=241478 RepID=A0A183IJK3_9BILA|nr:unnamed protein product [Soboliphyme baturini]